MSTETKINISSVVGIREAIEQIFTLIIRHLDAFEIIRKNYSRLKIATITLIS